MHNVGGSGQYDGGAAALTDEDWQSALNANLLAAVRLDREIIPGMVTRGSGAIVHITSIQRRAPLPTSIPYAAAKAALTNYSKALSNELAPKGIRVNAVCPGYIETESAYRMAEEIGLRAVRRVARGDHRPVQAAVGRVAARGLAPLRSRQLPDLVCDRVGRRAIGRQCVGKRPEQARYCCLK